MPKKGGRIKRLPNGTHGFLLPKGMDPDISTWTVENVVFWVSGLALEGARAIASRFRDKKVDGAALLEYKAKVPLDMMQDFGVDSIGIAQTLLRRIGDLPGGEEHVKKKLEGSGRSFGGRGGGWMAEKVNELEARHKACTSDWHPVAGAGAGFCTFTEEERERAFDEGLFAAPEAPRQLAMPKLVVCVAEDTGAEDDSAESLLGRNCAVCGVVAVEDEKFKRCGGKGCRVWYCGMQHQKLAWKTLGHKHSCGCTSAPTIESVTTAGPAKISALLQEFGRTERVFAECLKWCTESSLEALVGLANEGGKDLISRGMSNHPGMAEDAQEVLGLFPRPGLSEMPNEVVLAILARLPRALHPIISAVCRRWRVLVRNEAFLEARRCCPVTGKSLLETMYVLSVCRNSLGLMGLTDRCLSLLVCAGSLLSADSIRSLLTKSRRQERGPGRASTMASPACSFAMARRPNGFKHSRLLCRRRTPASRCWMKKSTCSAGTTDGSRIRWE